MSRPIALLLALALATPAAARKIKDFDAQPSDFHCLAEGRSVEGHKVRIFNAHKSALRKAVRIVKRGRPNHEFPVGTILQLVPFEAMVKRRKGFNPAGNDWEFFALNVTAAGTTIRQRGGPEVVNVFNGTSCQTCHARAARFDLVCEQSHGCDPLGVSDDLLLRIQAADPRCPKP
jgi:hypothetical protein